MNGISVVSPCRPEFQFFAHPTLPAFALAAVMSPNARPFLVNPPDKEGALEVVLDAAVVEVLSLPFALVVALEVAGWVLVELPWPAALPILVAVVEVPEVFELPLTPDCSGLGAWPATLVCAPLDVAMSEMPGATTLVEV